MYNISESRTLKTGYPVWSGLAHHRLGI